jgi:hypothetical protein
MCIPQSKPRNVMRTFPLSVYAVCRSQRAAQRDRAALLRCTLHRPDPLLLLLLTSACASAKHVDPQDANIPLSVSAACRSQKAAQRDRAALLRRSLHRPDPLLLLLLLPAGRRKQRSGTELRC